MKTELCKGIKRSAFKLQEEPCTNKVWKDGYCKIHHPDERRRKQREKNDKKDQKWNKAQDGRRDKAKNIEANLFTVGNSLCPSCMRPISQNHLKCKNEIHKIYAERSFI